MFSYGITTSAQAREMCDSLRDLPGRRGCLVPHSSLQVTVSLRKLRISSKRQPNLFGVKSTTQIIQSAAMKVRTEVLHFAPELPSEEVAEKLGINEKDPVLHFERVRYADDRPLVLEKSWIPAAQCPDLKREDIKGSLYLVLFKKYHHHIAAAHQSLRAILASELDARILDLQIDEPVMLVHGVAYLDDGRAIEVEESHFRGESIEFIIELGEHSQYARLMPHDLLRSRKSTVMKAVGH